MLPNFLLAICICIVCGLVYGAYASPIPPSLKPSWLGHRLTSDMTKDRYYLTEMFNGHFGHMKNQKSEENYPISLPIVHLIELKRGKKINLIYYKHPYADDTTQTMFFMSPGAPIWRMNSITRLQRQYEVNILYVAHSIFPRECFFDEWKKENGKDMGIEETRNEAWKAVNEEDSKKAYKRSQRENMLCCGDQIVADINDALEQSYRFAVNSRLYDPKKQKLMLYGLSSASSVVLHLAGELERNPTFNAIRPVFKPVLILESPYCSVSSYCVKMATTLSKKALSLHSQWLDRILHSFIHTFAFVTETIFSMISNLFFKACGCDFNPKKEASMLKGRQAVFLMAPNNDDWCSKNDFDSLEQTLNKKPGSTVIRRHFDCNHGCCMDEESDLEYLHDAFEKINEKGLEASKREVPKKPDTAKLDLHIPYDDYKERLGVYRADIKYSLQLGTRD